MLYVKRFSSIILFLSSKCCSLHVVYDKKASLGKVLAISHKGNLDYGHKSTQVFSLASTYIKETKKNNCQTVCREYVSSHKGKYKN